MYSFNFLQRIIEQTQFSSKKMSLNKNYFYLKLSDIENFSYNITTNLVMSAAKCKQLQSIATVAFLLFEILQSNTRINYSKIINYTKSKSSKHGEINTFAARCHRRQSFTKSLTITVVSLQFSGKHHSIML
jgi:hypothetical protein